MSGKPLLICLCVSVLLGCSPEDKREPERNPGGQGGSSGGSGASNDGGRPPGGSGGAIPSPAGTGGSSPAGSGGAAAPGSGGAGGTPIGDAATGAPDTSAADSAGESTVPTAGADLVPSAACGGGATLPGPDGYQNIMANGRARKYLIRVPRTYDGKTPLALIFAFHGGGANGTSFEGRIASIRSAVGDRAIYVYPDGQALNGTITWARDFKDDLAFVEAIHTALKEKVCFNTARVFAMGQSSGAYFSHTVGCNLPNLFRAVASNGGGARENEFGGCKGQVAAWISNGAQDAPHLPWARRGRDEWVKLNGCTMTNPAKVEPAPCVSYTGCKSGFPVHYCENGGGHDIPGYMPKGMSDFFFGKFDK